jgi:Ca2+-binding EF-hand superfamily protein
LFFPFSLFPNKHTKKKNSISITFQLTLLTRYLGVIMTDAEVMNMIREAGGGFSFLSFSGFFLCSFSNQINQKKKKGADSLDQNQYLSWMGRKMTSSLNAEDLVMAFKVFDKDGSGLISVPELRFVMCCLGDKLDDEIVDAMLDTADPSGTGHIRYEPFVRQMMAQGNF